MFMTTSLAAFVGSALYYLCLAVGVIGLIAVWVVLKKKQQ
jgi:hypothetical protein